MIFRIDLWTNKYSNVLSMSIWYYRYSLITTLRVNCRNEYVSVLRNDLLLIQLKLTVVKYCKRRNATTSSRQELICSCISQPMFNIEIQHLSGLSHMLTNMATQWENWRHLYVDICCWFRTLNLDYFHEFFINKDII